MGQFVSALSAHGITLAEAFAIAAIRAIEAKPDCFGSIADRRAYRNELRELILERERLFQLVESGWNRQDVDVLDPAISTLRDQGYTRTVFRRGGGVVAIGERAGERLIGHLVDADSAAKRAA